MKPDECDGGLLLPLTSRSNSVWPLVVSLNIHKYQSTNAERQQISQTFQSGP